MAKVFKYGLIIFIFCALVTHRYEAMLTGILDTPVAVLQLVMTIVLSCCLWNGFLNIIKASGLINHISFICRPLLRLIYGDIIADDEMYLYLSSNFIANLLGVGSLASISGLQAMRALQKRHPERKKPGKEMMILVIVNTAGLSLIPTTLMTVRQTYGAKDLLSFFKYSILIGTIITILGIIISKVIEKHD